MEARRHTYCGSSGQTDATRRCARVVGTVRPAFRSRACHGCAVASNRSSTARVSPGQRPGRGQEPGRAAGHRAAAGHAGATDWGIAASVATGYCTPSMLVNARIHATVAWEKNRFAFGMEDPRRPGFGTKTRAIATGNRPHARSTRVSLAFSRSAVADRSHEAKSGALPGLFRPVCMHLGQGRLNALPHRSIQPSYWMSRIDPFPGTGGGSPPFHSEDFGSGGPGPAGKGLGAGRSARRDRLRGTPTLFPRPFRSACPVTSGRLPFPAARPHLAGAAPGMRVRCCGCPRLVPETRAGARRGPSIYAAGCCSGSQNERENWALEQSTSSVEFAAHRATFWYLRRGQFTVTLPRSPLT